MQWVNQWQVVCMHMRILMDFFDVNPCYTDSLPPFFISGTSPGLVPTWVWLFSAFTTFCAYALGNVQ